MFRLIGCEGKGSISKNFFGTELAVVLQFKFNGTHIWNNSLVRELAIFAVYGFLSYFFVLDKV